MLATRTPVEFSNYKFLVERLCLRTSFASALQYFTAANILELTAFTTEVNRIRFPTPPVAAVEHVFPMGTVPGMT